MRKAFFAVAALAVMFAITVAANGTAKSLITGRDIKDNSIQSRDIADRTIVGRDLSRTLLNSLQGGGAAGPAGPAGPAGARGAAGPAGPQGDTGPTGATGATGSTGAQGAKGDKGDDGDDGVSALDAVPSGQTIRGAVGADFDASVFPSDWGTDMTLPMRAANNLADGDVAVNVAGQQQNAGQTPATSSDAADAACTGTPEAPTAPAGKVCIYVSGADNAVNVHGVSVLFGAGASPFGFKIVWDVLHGGDTFVDATWAYTAP